MERIREDHRPYNVCIFGASLDTGNMGVSALAASLIKIISDIRPDARISLLTGSRSSESRELELSGKKITIRIVNYRLSPKARMKEHLFCIVLLAFLHGIAPSERIRNALSRYCPWLEALKEADFIGDVRGGDSFSDIYGLQRILIGSLPPLTTLLLRKRLVLLPQTYGPYRSTIARGIARYFFRRSAPILSRDRESLELISELLGDERGRRDVQLCPDVAFLLDSRVPEDMDIRPPLPDRDPGEPLIGFNVNGLLYHGGYTRDNMFNLHYDYKLFVHGLTDRLLNDTKARILLIPHTFAPEGHVESDNDACRELFRQIATDRKDRVHLASGTYDQSAVKGIIGRCDFFIGSRMHACIAALSQGIPAVAVAYSRKFKGVFDSVGATDLVIDARSSDLEASIDRICELYRQRERVRATLQAKVEEADRRVWAIFRSMLDLPRQ